MKNWILLFRPWSFTATLVPFLVAAGLCAHTPGCRWGYWAAGIVSGLLFQSTVNLLNTWGDETSGVDNVPGAIRTTPQVHDGLVSLRAVLVAGLSCALFAGLLGIALCFYRDGGTWHLNLPLLATGFIGFLGATNYSTGIQFKYHGLGVPFVSFLMGPLEIFAACALLLPSQAGRLLAQASTDPRHFLAALLLVLPVAALVGVIMHGNDMRDIPSDRAAGIVTLASWMGPRGALRYYQTCHAIPYLTAMLWSFVATPWMLLVFLVLPLSAKTVFAATRTYRQVPDNPPWRRLERASGGIHFLFGLCYALALALR